MKFEEKWTRQAALDALKEFARANGRAPTAKELTPPMPSNSALRRLFGGVRLAIVEAGLRPRSTGRGRSHVSDEDVLEWMRKFFREHGWSPTSREVSDALHVSITGRWRSHNEALKAAGLPKRQPGRVVKSKEPHIIRTHSAACRRRHYVKCECSVWIVFLRVNGHNLRRCFPDLDEARRFRDRQIAEIVRKEAARPLDKIFADAMRLRAELAKYQVGPQRALADEAYHGLARATDALHGMITGMPPEDAGWNLVIASPEKVRLR